MIVCYTDGGYNRYRKPKGYGSFAIFRDNNLIKMSHFDLNESKTSNESEYLSLIELLKYLEENFKKEHCFVYMDSRLVYCQVENKWRVLAENLKEYHSVAFSLKKKLNVKLIWVGRKKIVSVLGH